MHSSPLYCDPVIHYWAFLETWSFVLTNFQHTQNLQKMKSIIITFLLSAVLGFFASTSAKGQAIEQKLTERVSIRFPAAYKKQDMGANTLYNLRLADSTANFVAVVSDLLKSIGLDAATLTAASMSTEFWDQAEEGFMAQMGPDAKLLGREMKQIAAYDIMQLTIERPVKENNTMNTLTVWIFVDDVYSLNIAHTNRGGKADENLKKAFFESITIK